MTDPRFNKLSDAKVRTLMRPGIYGDGCGLWLQVQELNGRVSKSWLFRFMRNGRARAMGLGATHTFGLKEARERARRARQQLADDIDPIDARDQDRLRDKLEAVKHVTFKEACERYVAAHESSWDNPKHRLQWRSTLATACIELGALPVSAIDTALVLKVLEPMWLVKPATASRLRGRIERVLSWATTSGFRSGDNPARWGGHLDQLLAKHKTNIVKHHPAMPFDELPSFMAELRQRDDLISAPALEFTILTAARTGEVTGATWDEIDLDKKTWTIPAERMKMEKLHRVPLSDRALEILQALPREAGNFVFMGVKAGAPLNHSTMLAILKGMRPGYVPHGFRSTFRDWAAERTNFPSQVVEMALAHAIGDKVEAAYRRGDLFEKRRKLMDAWASFCNAPQEVGTVVPFKKVAS